MTRLTDKTAAWEWTGLIATAVIVLGLPLYYFALSRLIEEFIIDISCHSHDGERTLAF